MEEAEAQLRINVLEMKAAKSDHTDCRIPPKPSKHSGRLGVTPYRGLERVEIVSLDICKGNSDNGKTKGRPFCVTPVTTTTVHVMGTGPLLHGRGCPATKMDTCSMVFPPFSLIGKVLRKIQEDRVAVISLLQHGSRNLGALGS